MSKINPWALSVVGGVSIFAATYILFWALFLCFDSPNAAREAINVLGSYFGGVATLWAAVVAAYLFTDWKEQHNKSIISNDAKTAFHLIHNERNLIHDIKFYLAEIENIDEYNLYDYRDRLQSHFNNLIKNYNKNRYNLGEFINLTENSDFHKQYLIYGGFLNDFSTLHIQNIRKDTYGLRDAKDYIKEAELLNNKILTELKKYIFVQ
ncbi:hypothetical protein [Acinetobacter lwoffii]|uniref:Phage abortive infection protein n=1 Tax=Acinetobacter lwoffii TaxID=28090 RepID=A0AAW3VEG1_ACILW|nr:hypothetical protein [Acinetobacter lwoffii]MBB6363523.1 hypothetical protein [Acinetobacter lwoffii]